MGAEQAGSLHCNRGGIYYPECSAELGDLQCAFFAGYPGFISAHTQIFRDKWKSLFSFFYFTAPLPPEFLPGNAGSSGAVQPVTCNGPGIYTYHVTFREFKSSSGRIAYGSVDLPARQLHPSHSFYSTLLSHLRKRQELD